MAADGERTTGDAALLAAVTAPRTGRMGDIVATIQAEQDRVIRASERGVLVVQGGPGTGKTAVALHRTAYLLYTHRDRLARSGVLLLGPARSSCATSSRCCPRWARRRGDLTLGEMYPGVVGRGEDSPTAARVKGSLRMVDVLDAAVAARQRVPARPIRFDLDGTRVQLRPEAIASARTRARRTRKPHNLARVTFVREVLNSLVNSLARARGVDLGEERDDLVAELRENVDVRREVNLCWMPLTPRRCWPPSTGTRRCSAEVAPGLSERDRDALHREDPTAWTEADVPLLDELAELLGPLEETATDARAAAEREEQVAYARKVLEDFEASGVGNPLVSPELLADRFATGGPSGTVAERAAVDRTWAYGHVVVDEAQELSAMAWRLVERRCPSRSMTLVGDVAQTSNPPPVRGPGAGAETRRRRPVAAGGAHRQLPDPGEDLPRRRGRAAGRGISANPPTPVREGEHDPSRSPLEGVPPSWTSSGRGSTRSTRAASPSSRRTRTVRRSDALRAAVTAALPAGSVAASPTTSTPPSPSSTSTAPRAWSSTSWSSSNPRAVLRRRAGRTTSTSP